MRILLLFLIVLVSCGELPQVKRSTNPVQKLHIIDHVGFDNLALHYKLNEAKEALKLEFEILYEIDTTKMTIGGMIAKTSAVVLEDTSYTDTITIHIVDNIDDMNGMEGFGTGSLDTTILKMYPKYYSTIYVRPNGIRSNAIVHELGHLFGLKHTFDDGSRWGSNAEKEGLVDKFNYMSYNPHTDNLTDWQRDIVLTFYKIRNR